MSSEIQLMTSNQYPPELDKHLIANMNTNCSLALSQTIRQNHCRQDAKNAFLQTKQTIFAGKQYSLMSNNSDKRGEQQLKKQNYIPHHKIGQQDVDFLLYSQKMVSFLSKKNMDNKKYIENRAGAVKQLTIKINQLVKTIKFQKEQYLVRFNNFKQRSDRLKIERRSISKRLKTEITDLKSKIHSIKKRSSIYQTNHSGSTVKQTRRRNSQRVCTQRSEEKRVYVPMINGYQTINLKNPYQQYHSVRRTNPQVYYQTSKNFQRTGDPIFINLPTEKSEEFLKKSSKQINKITQNNSSKRNIFDILGQRFRIPPTANTVESLTANKDDQSMISSLLKLSKSKEKFKSDHYENQSEVESQNTSILDEQTIKMAQENKISSVASQKSKSKQNHSKQSTTIKFVPSDFKLGNLGDSVQSQYTDTERPFQQFNKQKKKVQKSQSSQYNSRVSSSSISHNSEVDDIIDSIKLSSRSKFQKQKLAESKYIPYFDSPSQCVENSQLQELNLLAQSNISMKRVSNSKIIKKKLQSLEMDNKIK